MTFARQHPALSVIGAAGVGLIGGFELAAGVLLGAGVVSLIGRRNGHDMRHEAEEAARTVRTRAQRIKDLAPKVRERARAVVQAARGELQPIHSEHAQQTPMPAEDRPTADELRSSEPSTDEFGILRP